MSLTVFQIPSIARLQPAPLPRLEQERRQHCLTHFPFRDWCKPCVFGRGKDDPHAATARVEADDALPKVQMDFCFMESKGAGGDGKATGLTITCVSTGAIASSALPGKAMGAFLVGLVTQILAVWGYTDVVLWTDQEEAITAVVNEVAKRRNHRTIHRRIARYSHASLGYAEQGNLSLIHI